MIFYLYIFETQCRRPFIFQTMNSDRSSNLILKKSNLSLYQELSSIGNILVYKYILFAND